MKSPISYFGGKSKLAPKLISLFPEHIRYVEVFGGGGSVLFAKPRSTIEVYNDLDSAVFDFFWVLSRPQLFGRFKRMVEALPLSRNLHAHCLARWEKEKSQVSRAAMWFAAQRQSFSAILGNQWGYSVARGNRGLSASVSKWLSSIDRLPEAHARLQTVQMDNRDFQNVLHAYDKPDTFFYLDPPYAPKSRKSGKYRCELTEERHRELVAALLALEGKAMLSGYDTELYAPLEAAGWYRREFDVVCNAAGLTRGSGLQGKGKLKEKQKRTEVVWMNYSPPE